jgi:hypothetical protein
MSAWGLLAAPLMAQAAEPGTTTIAAPMSEPAAVVGEASDLFGGLATMDDSAMQDASGGSDTAINIGNIDIINIDSEGTIENATINANTTNSQNGQIANNAVANNNGITTVFNNTGNGVIMQSTVNVNIFMGGSQ